MTEAVLSRGTRGTRPGASRTRTRRQTELLDRLEALFLAEGFAHFTLDDLAARLRCSKSTLYALAPSKEQLAVSVVRHYFKSVAARIEERIRDVTDVRERIGAYLAAIGDELRPASGEFIEDIAAFEPARAAYETNARFAAERIRGFIREGVEQGVFRDVHAALVAEMINVTIAGIQRGDILERTGLTSADAFAELATFVLNGLAPVAPQDDGGVDKTRRAR
ncbi:MAG: TetR/AcrR family transcriptional regulator [Sphaerobacter sp.]|nr:TetR/AcrR family transcriptional regulator [Sphaerobacter sp.]